jgi:hypothetical protein
MTIPFENPSYRLSQFNCPHCLAHSHQIWGWANFKRYDESIDRFSEIGLREERDLKCSICNNCKKSTYWLAETQMYPDVNTVAPANQDLSDEIIADYNEAASIMMKSPRGAAALLRLGLQKLCIQLGEKGKKIDDDIASLVQKGLPPRVQKALDIVRVTGNESVHPGQMDLKDDVNTVNQLFKLLNFIADKMITEPSEVDALFDGLPESKRDGIVKRDQKNE